jgi:hypothetical protein
MEMSWRFAPGSLQNVHSFQFADKATRNCLLQTGNCELKKHTPKVA